MGGLYILMIAVRTMAIRSNCAFESTGPRAGLKETKRLLYGEKAARNDPAQVFRVCGEGASSDSIFKIWRASGSFSSLCLGTG
jgi:hypothetical protein